MGTFIILQQFNHNTLLYFFSIHSIPFHSIHSCTKNTNNNNNKGSNQERSEFYPEKFMEVCRKLTNMIGDDKDDYNFKETELCLGLPGGGSGGGGNENDDHQLGKNSGKRGFSETIDLQLNLQSSSKDCLKSDDTNKNTIKKNCPKEIKNLMPTCSNDDPAKESPASKALVVGWPPVRSFRKNIVSVQKDSNEEEKVSSSATFVKVSMDGAPYLRKVDLRMYKSYQELSDALGKMFSSFTIGNCESQGMKDFMNESKLMDLLNGSEYLPTYEDKDGDWMLVGDVPWEMFVDSCKRLRIMKGSDAIGLAPRAVEKCKNRS